MDEDSENVQEQELFVLRSMYDADLDENYTASAWTARKKKQPTDPKEFLITIHPQGKALVSCGLYVKFPKRYPRVAPTLDIKNATGLSPAFVASLLAELRREADNKLGGFMIAELVSLCEERINTLNDQVATARNKSLAVEMSLRTEEHEQKRREEEREAVERLRREDEGRKAALVTQIEEEDRKTREKAMTAKQQKRAERKTISKTLRNDAEGSFEQGGRKETFEPAVMIDGIPVNTFRLSDPRQDGLGTTWIAEPLLTSSSDLLDLECFIVTFKASFYSTIAGQRKLKELEADIHRLTHFSHDGLVRLFAVKLAERQTGTSRLWALHILRERTDGISLGHLLHHCPQLGIETALDYLRQIMSSLVILHSQKMLHQDLTSESILLIKSADIADVTVVKVRGAFYIRKLADLNKSNPIDMHAVTDFPVTFWQPPEAIDRPLVYTPARDIWCLGVIWVQMLWGSGIVRRFPNIESLLVSGLVEIPFYLAEIMRSILSPNPSQRPRCEILLQRLSPAELQSQERSLIRTKLDITTPTISKARLGSSPEQSYFLSSAPSPWPPMSSRSTPSRFKEEFEHLEHLGRGGFGSVDKVKMKLDNMIYAIKRIRLRPSDSESRILREVNALSQLNHRHIVRYITCWLESSAIETRDATPESGSSEGTGPSRSRRLSAVASDENLFKLNNDDFDSDHELTRTRSFPSVVFVRDGEDFSDESSEDETSTEGESDSGSRVIKPPSPRAIQPNLQRVLYIQMEFVEQQTLKEAVASGLSEERTWQLFRQVLEALAHMFSLGIVHRDIKLTNILIDKHGDAKLGDFGLAQVAIATSSADEGSIAIGPWLGDSQQSSGVGTFLYVAPEVKSSKPGPRNLAKADMFSLGIVFFEMVQGSFKTDQERFVVIQNLREGLSFPGSWTQRHKERKIVEWLLHNDPSKRPTAVELLQSGLLPERLENRRLEDALRLLVDKEGPHRQELLGRLFSQPQDDIRPFVYDQAEQPAYLFLQGVVSAHLETVFHRHGAINIDPPLLLPVMPVADVEQPTVAAYLDKQGNIVCLPTDGFLPFARLVVRRGITRIKRYSIGHAYEQGAAGGQPRATAVAMFDIVSMDRSMAAEGEAMAVVETIIRSTPGMHAYQWDIHVSHGAILTALYNQVSQAQKPTLDHQLKQDSSAASYFDRSALLDVGLPKLCVEELETLIGISGDFETAVKRLPQRIATTAKAAITELRDAIRHAALMGVQSRILFTPAINSYYFYFKDGVFFEFSPRGQRTTVLANGGRYDCLVKSVAPPTTQSPSVVGVQISLERIMMALSRHQSTSVKKLMNNKIDEERSFGLWAPRRADVYVCSFQPGRLEERVAIVNMLWEHGISADLMYDSAVDDSLEKIMSTCLKEGILYVVLTRAQTTGSALRVKSVLRKTEVQVSRQELIAYLSHQLAEQKRIDQTISGGKTVAVSLDRASNTVREQKQPAVDMQLLLPAEEKGKKKRAREIFRDKADKLYVDVQRAVQSGIPIIAVAVSATVFARLTQDTAWVTDDEAWRAVSSVFDKQHDYANQIREAIAARKADGHRFLFLLSVREEPRRAFMFHFA